MSIKILRILTLALCGSFVADAYAQTANPNPIPKLVFRKNPPSENTSLNIALGAGFGQYPILELPMTEFTDVRVDGSSNTPDLRRNTGGLLSLQLGYQARIGQLPVNIGASVERIASAPGGTLATPSSFVRFNVQGMGVFDLNPVGLRLSSGIAARRSMYRNVDSGHYIDAILLKAAIATMFWNHYVLDLDGGFSPYSKFGVSQNSNSGRSGILAETKVAMTDIGARFSWVPNQETIFFLGASQENVTVSIDNMDSYRSYGLNVDSSPGLNSPRSYNLSVVQVMLGAIKRL